MPTRVGLVGAGGIAVEHAAAWAALGAEMAVYSTEGAEQLAAAHGADVAATFDDLVERSDVVDVLTPTPAHHTYALRALRAGKHVICEKPMARTSEEAAELVTAAAGAGVHLYPAHVVRFFPQYAALHDAVRAGRVGRVAVQRFTRSGVFPAWSPWFADFEQSGGIVMDQMIHDLDVARWLAGEVVEVYATQRTAGQGAHTRQTAHVTLTHAAGAISHVAGVWGPPHLTFRTSFDVAGDAGNLHFDSAEQSTVRLDLDRRSGGELRAPDGGPESPYLTQIRELAAAISGGSAPRVSAVDGAIAVDLAVAGIESLARGAAVRVDTAARVRELNRTAATNRRNVA
jgi:myo-inositol 2-dehydrogenase/D-chiro-inositol 1-dehydrogenase